MPAWRIVVKFVTNKIALFAFSEKIEWNIHNISKNKRHSTKS